MLVPTWADGSHPARVALWVFQPPLLWSSTQPFALRTMTDGPPTGQLWGYSISWSPGAGS